MIDNLIRIKRPIESGLILEKGVLKYLFLIITILVSPLLPLVVAHSPINVNDNESIESATVIPDPAKSWALYAALSSDGDAQYYTLAVAEKQVIPVSLFKSLRPQDVNFTPSIVIMAKNLTSTDVVPAQVTVPSEYGARLVPSSTPQKTYEPFSPGTLANLAEITLDVPGIYYLAVYEESDTPRGGNYGLAVGSLESFTLQEWVLIPFSLLNIYQWEGQSLPLIFAPMLMVMAVGVSLIAWKLRNLHALTSPFAWMGTIGGLAFLGTGVTILFQLTLAATQVNIGVAAALTFFLALIPMVLGLLTVVFSLRYSLKAPVRKRLYLVILGVAAIFIWAGYLIGPVLAILAAVAPTANRRHV